jgi:hypothetical protein
MGTIYAGAILGSGYATSNTTGAASGTLNPASMVFHGAGGVSVGISAGSVIISGATGGGTGGAGDGFNILAAGGSTAGSNVTIGLLDAGGVSFGFTNGTQISATVKTDYQSSGAYLLTAAQSDHTHSQYQGTGAYLLTARASNDGIGLNSALTANGVSMSANSSGLSLNFPAFLVTAAQSDHTHSQYQSTGAYLLTARASNDGIGLNSALTANGVSMSANSSGLSLNFPAFLTTAAGVSHSHGNPTIALTNLSGTTASGSAGFTLSLSAAAPGAGGGIGLNTAATNVTWTVDSSGISLNAGAYLVTAAQSDHSHGNPTIALTNITGTTASGSNGFTLSLSGNAAGGGGATLSLFEPIPICTGTAWGTVDSRTTYWQPLMLDAPLAFKWVDCVMSASAACPAGSSSNTNQTFQVGYTHNLSIFKRRDHAASSGSLTYVTHGGFYMTYRMEQRTGNMSATMSFVTDTNGGTIQVGTTSGATANLVAAVNGPRVYRMPFVATTLDPGEYYIAQARSTSGASTSGTTLSNCYLISNLFYSPISYGLAGFRYHSLTVATTAHLGGRYPILQGVANAHTSNADMNESAISNGTVSHWLVNFANF